MVDDDRALRDVLRRALSLSGYEIRVAETGSEALAEVNGGVPDAVVLDVGLTVTGPLGDTLPNPGVIVTVSAFKVLYTMFVDSP